MRAQIQQIEMAKMDLSLLRRKFRGSLLGVLAGDCLGSPYENENILTSGEKMILQKSLDKLEGTCFKAPVMQYTDDSSMTRSVAESLSEKRCLDLCDMAKKFVKSYYQERHRGYGASVVTVFHKLRGNKFSDILGPAKEQFHGQGSLGNGGAMRVAPVALFYHRDYDKLIETTRWATAVTHTHKMGIDGAILQAIAIQQSLLLNPEDELDTIKFVDELIGKMDFIEVDNEGYLRCTNQTTCNGTAKMVNGVIVSLNSHSQFCMSDESTEPVARFKQALAEALSHHWYGLKDLYDTLAAVLDFIETQPFKAQLNVIRTFLKEENEELHAVKVVQVLGNDVTAAQSVPTAIFCFLRAQKPIEGIQTDNPLRRAIQYAISLGGDADTIAAMTGALAGAFYGETKINSLLLEHCEASTEFRNLGDKLFEVSIDR